MRAVLCTHNPHKVDELRALLPGIELAPLERSQELPPEDGATFLDNARIKARAGARLYPATWSLADDSGLEVEALDGAPGVWSARFAGPGATDEENVQLLLEHLSAVPSGAARAARFVCVLVAIAPDGTEYHAEGSVSGKIAAAPAGANGFGYDPVFIPVGHEATFAELHPGVKQRLSHRARAAAALAEQLGTAAAPA